MWDERWQRGGVSIAYDREWSTSLAHVQARFQSRSEKSEGSREERERRRRQSWQTDISRMHGTRSWSRIFPPRATCSPPSAVPYQSPSFRPPPIPMCGRAAVIRGGAGLARIAGARRVIRPPAAGAAARGGGAAAGGGGGGFFRDGGAAAGVRDRSVAASAPGQAAPATLKSAAEMPSQPTLDDTFDVQKETKNAKSTEADTKPISERNFS